MINFYRERENGGRSLRQVFLRRSLLYVPGSSLKKMNKALSLNADSIIFDLEDSVSLQEKDQARKNVAEFILKAKGIGKEILVRINDPKSFFGIEDILKIVPKRPDALIIPKADENNMITADNMINAIESSFGLEKNKVKMIPLIETTYSITNAYKILSLSKRINGVQFGAEDLTMEMNIKRTRRGDELWYARSMLIFAGRALELDIIDSPFTDIEDERGLIDETTKINELGMTGKTCIHPAQLSVVNNIFNPRLEDVEYARRVVEYYETSIKKGKGAFSLDGKMIDNPIVERAKKMIEKAELIES